MAKSSKSQDHQPLEPTEALLANAILGEDAALEALIIQQSSRVFALTRAILKDAEWAQDATQETFLRMVRTIERFDPSEERFGAWLLAIARNVALDLWRMRRVRGELGYEAAHSMDEPVPAEWMKVSPLDVLIAGEDCSRVAAAIERLSLPSREVLVLRFFHDLEPIEIAKVLQISPESARIRLWRALRELRKRLTKDG